MAAANPLWGAPRIHGELCKLGIIEAFPEDRAPRWLLRDRDTIYGDVFRRARKSIERNKRQQAAKNPPRQFTFAVLCSGAATTGFAVTERNVLHRIAERTRITFSRSS
jgi:hypothetical protein